MPSAFKFISIHRAPVASTNSGKSTDVTAAHDSPPEPMMIDQKVDISHSPEVYTVFIDHPPGIPVSINTERLEIESRTDQQSIETDAMEIETKEENPVLLDPRTQNQDTVEFMNIDSYPNFTEDKNVDMLYFSDNTSWSTIRDSDADDSGSDDEQVWYSDCDTDFARTGVCSEADEKEMDILCQRLKAL